MTKAQTTAPLLENHPSVLPTVQNVAMTPMEMLDKAIQQGANVDVLEKLMGLQERWEKNQARKDFDAAIAAAKSEMPKVVRNQTGHNSKKYADFAGIAATVDPVLSKHGLSYRFRSEAGDKINVTCVLSHKSGHSEETTLTGPPDSTGNKNSVQAIGSTLTYLQRYSLMQSLGIGASDDNDAKDVDMGNAVNAAELAQLIALADDVGADKAKFCKHIKVESFADIPASKFKFAMDQLESKRKKA